MEEVFGVHLCAVKNIFRPACSQYILSNKLYPENDEYSDTKMPKCPLLVLAYISYSNYIRILSKSASA
jgi:hypothetical protein